MGIFTRFHHIVSSNINAMLDKAEDPEKMIKLIIREMEDTLVELKASCAGVIAERKKAERRLEEVKSRMDYWSERAELAVSRERDDLAREALKEKRRFSQMAASLEEELVEHAGLVGQYQDDIRQIEDKLTSTREKKRVLVQRHIRARQKKQAQEELRRVDHTDAIAKFDELENRIERMEAEADLVNFGRRPTLDEEFDRLKNSDDIEKELEALKSSRKTRQDAP